MNDFIEYRLEICGRCPYNLDGECCLCGCNLEIKTADPNEKCPHTPLRWNTQANSVKKEEVQSAPVDLGGGGASITGRSSATPCIPCQSKSR